MSIGLKRGAVVLNEYTNDWAVEYEQELSRLQPLLPGCHIEHVGSTSVPGLVAKPIIDIAIGYETGFETNRAVEALVGAGYKYMPNRITKDEIFMPKGPDKKRTHYVHLVPLASDGWRDMLDFRNYLRENATARKGYALLKQSLAVDYANDRAGYTALKNEFIQNALKRND